MTFAVGGFLLGLMSLVLQWGPASRRKDEGASPVRDDDGLLHAIWLEEIESRGQQLLQQFADAEERLLARESVMEKPEASTSPSFAAHFDAADATALASAHPKRSTVGPTTTNPVTTDPPTIAVSTAEEVSIHLAPAAPVATDVAPDAPAVPDEGTDVARGAVAEEQAATGSRPRRKAGHNSLELARTVHELADDGFDAATIARRLQIGAGKVELILGLRREGVLFKSSFPHENPPRDDRSIS